MERTEKDYLCVIYKLPHFLEMGRRPSLRNAFSCNHRQVWMETQVAGTENKSVNHGQLLCSQDQAWSTSHSSSIFLGCYKLQFPRQNLLWNQNLADSASLVVSLLQKSPVSVPWEYVWLPNLPQFCVHLEALNSSLHTWKARTSHLLNHLPITKVMVFS